MKNATPKRLSRFWQELPRLTVEVGRGKVPPDDLVSYERPAEALPGFQESYDAMGRQMLTQVAPARTPDGKNRYRWGDGGCPVGALIGPGSGDIEGLSCLDPFIQTLLQNKGHNPGLCWSIQVIHDHIPQRDWPAYLRKMADFYRLDHDVVEQLEPQFLARLSKG